MSEDIEENTSPLMDHIIELRNRLMYSVIAIFFVFCGAYAVSEQIYSFLVEPLAQIMNETGQNRRLIYTALHEAFFTYIKEIVSIIKVFFNRLVIYFLPTLVLTNRFKGYISQPNYKGTPD